VFPIIAGQPILKWMPAANIPALARRLISTPYLKHCKKRSSLPPASTSFL
jgi:hypothetical protein